MRIEKLEIRGFGKLNNFTINFINGFNVVFGNNESGKTSIQSFIKGMFYGLKSGRTSRDGVLPNSKRYKPWSGNDYNGFVEYRLDDGELYKVGRNFGNGSVRIFDSLFNDITGTFEISKDRGALFAEKQLGINETCFEKTVFIKQMELKVDDDASRELLSRLTNISQTGFEDISFRKAQKALKEALKNYVGTDKTYTRPLDKVISRLVELKNAKEGLTGKRNSLFTIEDELKCAVDTRNTIENRKLILTRTKELIDLKKSIESNKKQKSGFDEILDRLRSCEEELNIISGRIEEFNKTKEKFECFLAYSDEDANDLWLEYHKLCTLSDEKKRLETEIKIKKEEAEKTGSFLGSLKAFSGFDDDIESTVLNFKKELDALKSEYDRNSMEVLNERIKGAEYKDKRAAYNIVITTVLSILLAIGGFVKFHALFIAALAGFAGAACLLLIKIRMDRELASLKTEKSMTFVSLNTTKDEMARKQKILDEIFQTAGASSVEDFLRLKAAYGVKIQQLAGLNNEVMRLEREYEAKSSSIYGLKSAIRDKLSMTGIIDERTKDIVEEHIKSFKYGVSSVKGLEPSINYAVQREKDLNNEIQGLYKKASDICGCQYNNESQLAKTAGELEEKVGALEEKLELSIKQVGKLYIEKGLGVSGFDCLKDKLLTDIEQLECETDSEHKNVCEELNNMLLKIKECETLLKSLTDDDDVVQRIDEEIVELEVAKGILEETGNSLKIALDVLTEASMEIQRDFVPALNNKMSDIIGRISGGRYTDVRADDNLCIKAVAPETGEVVSTSLLSGGTVDQVYLALRIAMADLIALSGEKLPFIMDEIFAQYDDERTGEALRFFNDLFSGRQMIFFTCKRREVDIAKSIFGNSLNVIELS